MAYSSYIFSAEEIAKISDAFVTLKAKRPYNNQQKPRDADFVQVYHFNYRQELDGVPSLVTDNVHYLVTEGEWDQFWDLIDRSKFADEFSHWVGTVIGETPIASLAGPAVNGLVAQFGNFEDAPEHNQITHLAAIGGHHDMSAEQIKAFIGLLKSMPLKKFGAVCASFQSAARELAREGAEARLGDENTIDWHAVDNLKNQSVGALVLKLCRSVHDVIIIGTHNMPDAMYRAGVFQVKQCEVHEGQAHLYFGANEVEIDEYERLVDPALGQAVASYVIQATGVTHESSYTDLSDLKLAMNCSIFHTRKIVDGKIMMDPSAVGAHRATASNSMGRSMKSVTNKLHDRLASIWSRFAMNVVAANPRQPVWSPPGREALSYLVEYVKDRNLLSEADRLEAMAIIGKLEGMIAKAKDLYDQGVANTVGQFSYNEKPCYQSVHLQYFDAGMVPMLLNRVRAVVELGRPSVDGPHVTELTMAKLAGRDLSLKEALSVAPWQICNKAGVPPTVGSDCSPSGLRALLEGSRKFIRISETDKNDGSGNARLVQSGHADCELFFAYLTQSAKQIEFANLLDQLQYGDFAGATFQNLVRGGCPGGGPGVIVYDSSPSFPFMTATMMKLGVSDITCYANMQVYCTDGEPERHRAPLLCRVPTPPHGIAPSAGKGKVLVMGDSWLDVKPNEGLDLSKPQQQLVEVAHRAKFSTLMMLCRMDAEWKARRSQNGKIPVPPQIVLEAAGAWKQVWFVPGIRPHNGMFWMICHGLREHEVVERSTDIGFKNAVGNWNAFYVAYAIAMIRGNVLKDLHTMLGVMAPHYPSEAIKQAFYPNVPRICGAYEAYNKDLAAWGFRTRAATALTKIITAEAETGEDFYNDTVIATTGELSSVSYVGMAPPPVPKPSGLGVRQAGVGPTVQTRIIHPKDHDVNPATEKGKEADE